jgi:LysM repeat protein
MAKNAAKETPKTIICATCGSKNAEGNTRCAVCGASLKSPSSVGKKRKRSSAEVTLSLPTALGILAIFIVLAVGLTFLATRGLGLGSAEEPEVTITLTPTETLTPSATPTETQVPSPTPLPTLEYFVVENDSLLAIAVRYDVSIQSILQLNPGLNSQSILSVGQRIYLAQPTPTASPEPTATLPPEEATRAACETIIYTVEANDTLGGIADNYNVNLRAIMDFNGMTSETVFLGQVLIIPLCERNPTPGPSPTPTPPPPYPAANLLLPQDGAAFSLADDSVTLQWAAVGELRENEFYRVTIEDVTVGTGTRKLIDYVKDTKYIIADTFRPNEAVPHVMRWWIHVVRQTGVTGDGEAIYETGGAISIKRDFTWSGTAPGATATP